MLEVIFDDFRGKLRAARWLSKVIFSVFSCNSKFNVPLINPKKSSPRALCYCCVALPTNFSIWRRLLQLFLNQNFFMTSFFSDLTTSEQDPGNVAYVTANERVQTGSIPGHGISQPPCVMFSIKRISVKYHC